MMIINKFITKLISKIKICKSKFYDLIPDKLYLQLKFRHIMKKHLNLNNPLTFNEKLQWLKLYDRRPEYTTFVDKYKVRGYISKTIGEEYLIPLLGVWDNPEDIDFDKLPNKFVLKCNHDSHSTCICQNKSQFNFKLTKDKLKICLKKNFYKDDREWPYKNVPHKIIAEAYMEDSNNKSLIDYKFYCFNGEPKFLYVSSDLNNHSTAKISFLTLDWNFAPFKRTDYKPFVELPAKPKLFNKMLDISKKLSKNIPFVRVDLYEINDKIYFSELTLFPCSGFMKFCPSYFDIKIGSWLNLSKTKIE